MQASRIALAASCAGPFAILGWTALHVHSNWARMPERFPTHWGPSGPDAWRATTPDNVNQILLMGVGLCLFIGVLTWLAYRRVPNRRRIHILIPIAAAYVGATAVSLMPLSALYPIDVGAIMVPIAVGLAALAIGVAILSLRSTDAAADTRHWKARMIYYNPSDSSTFVQSWTGFGWSLNFARPAAWIILALVIAIPFLIRLFTR